MSRIRTVKPEFWTSEQVASCSRDARLLFIGIWNYSDDNGIHPKSFKRLKMEIFPGDDDCSERDLERWIKELITCGLIMEYSINQKEYWYVTGWKNHQKIDKPTFRHPRPYVVDTRFENEPSSCSRLMFNEDSSNAHRILLENSSNTPLRKGMEGNGKDEDTCKVPDKTLHVSSIEHGESSSMQESIGKSHEQRHLISELPPFSTHNEASKVDPTIFDLFEHWRIVMKHPRAVLDAKRKKVITQALKLGYTINELKEAIDGCANTPFNAGLNESKKRYDDIGLIFRDAAHIESFIQNNKDIKSASVSSTTKLINTLSEGAI